MLALHRRWLAALVLVGLLAATAPRLTAGELKRERVPEDARWLVHVDFESLRDSQLFEQLQGNQPRVLKSLREWMNQELGIRPQRDLRSMTAFSRDYRVYRGTVFVETDYDADLIEKKLRSARGHSTTEWKDRTLHTITLSKQRASESGPSGDEEMTVVLVDDQTLLLGSSPKNAQAALKLLSSDQSTSSAEPTQLLENYNPDAWVFAAATGLQDGAKIVRSIPIVSKHKSIHWMLGSTEKNRMFEDVRLVANSEETAQQVQQLLEGLVAFQQLQSDQGEALQKLTDDVTIKRKGDTVNVHWEAPTKVVLESLQQLGDQVESLTIFKTQVRVKPQPATTSVKRPDRPARK